MANKRDARGADFHPSVKFHLGANCAYVCYSFVHVVRSRDYASWTYHIRHNVVSSLVTVCSSRSNVLRFLDFTSAKQRVNVTCSRPQRMAPWLGLEPGTP